MSAFNDYCIVCEKLCSLTSVYCSNECKLKDNDSHFDFDSNIPELISPVLQPRKDSIISTIDITRAQQNHSTVDQNKKSIVQEYLIKSPLLLTSSIKDQPIIGLSLDNYISLEETSQKILPQMISKSPLTNQIPNKGNTLDDEHAAQLAASSNNYKKWLNVAQ
ncbi:hypothetical protein WICMUC_000350 [Wickerhamomyces mucosus]|uniref:Uncharacterized protein n=1 Tax=Wickerhamomyces mucosus TaxID=1378264 RepID=A0A9P8TIU9_9ASCO|nr:hypothetical protein WICMUC_000350 [Wickerhamomyces mucosus]